jgi:hypothetical protein
MSKKSHTKTRAAMTAAAKRVSAGVFTRVKPAEPFPHNAPLRAMKSGDYTDGISLAEQLEEITPSTHGKISAKARDELRRKHGLPT